MKWDAMNHLLAKAASLIILASVLFAGLWICRSNGLPDLPPLGADAPAKD